MGTKSGFMRRFGLILVVTSALAPASATGQSARLWTLTVQVARNYPRMTAANDQIREINGLFGTSLASWNSVADTTVGVGVWRPVWRRMAAGLQLNLGQASLDRSQSVGPAANGQRLAFKGRHGLNLQLHAAVEYRPCILCQVVSPFIRAGLGLAYLSDERALTLTTAGSPSAVRAQATGVVPASMIGVGIDAPLGITNAWRVEVGGAYAWAKLSKTVSTSGSLLDMTEVKVESELTGPSAWIGMSYRF